MARSGTKQQHSKKDAPPTLCGPLAHPVRLRILDVLSEGPMSPVRFLDEGLSPIEFDKRERGLSYIAYHFRALEAAECIELIERNPRRGATEHVYRSIQRAFFSDEEFESLPFKKRQALSKSSLQAFIAKTDRAIQSGTFDSHFDRTMVWTSCNVDQQGWDEIRDVLGDAFNRAEKARKEAELRLRDQRASGADHDTDVMPYTFALLGFETPPRKQRI
jgi:DNA-binding transcriptional ArsR family regulator